MNSDVDINSYHIRPETVDDEFECPYYLEYSISGGGHGGEDDTWVDLIWEEFLTYEDALQRCREFHRPPEAIGLMADYLAEQTRKEAELMKTCGNYYVYDEF